MDQPTEEMLTANEAVESGIDQENLEFSPLVLSSSRSCNEVATVVSWRKPTPLPHPPAPILGVVSIQGRMLTVVDPAILFAEDGGQSARSSIVALRGDEQLALAVDEEGESLTPDGLSASEERSTLAWWCISERDCVLVVNKSSRRQFAAVNVAGAIFNNERTSFSNSRIRSSTGADTTRRTNPMGRERIAVLAPLPSLAEFRLALAALAECVEIKKRGASWTFSDSKIRLRRLDVCVLKARLWIR